MVVKYTIWMKLLVGYNNASCCGSQVARYIIIQCCAITKHDIEGQMFHTHEPK